MSSSKTIAADYGDTLGLMTGFELPITTLRSFPAP